ncbi:MAG: metallophosphoesterase family protein [Solirubrobacterales bacterium]
MVGLIYDIHGNATALRAVLEHADRAGATQFLLGGDYCMLGPEPAEVLALLRELPADSVWLRGNTERWLEHPDAPDIPNPIAGDACLFARAAIGSIDAKELAELPDTLIDVPLPGAAGIVFCHASPGSDMVGFTDEPADSDGAAADSGLEANTIVCGHTHIQFRREVGVVEVVNPGSVGFPFDENQQSAYALLDEDGSIELRRVDYDIERTIAAYGDHTGEWVDLAKRRLREARP